MEILKMKCALIAVLGLLAITTEAHAWGDRGHKVVCELALQLVAPQTRSRIDQLMAGDAELHSFAEACTWADHPRKRAAEHFLNLPRDSNGLSGESCGEATECVVTAIDKDFVVLASKRADPQSRLTSLKFLGHWVGDIHQPLHVSSADDRGGNDLKTTGECGPNLHAVWDTCLVRAAIGDDVAAAAGDLAAALTPQQRQAWAMGLPRDWANESFALSERPATGYCVKQGPAAGGPRTAWSSIGPTWPPTGRWWASSC